MGKVKYHQYTHDQRLYRYQVGILRCPHKWAKFGGCEGFSGNGVPGRISTKSTLGYQDVLRS